MKQLILLLILFSSYCLSYQGAKVRTKPNNDDLQPLQQRQDVPSDWYCSDSWYGDGGCDCLCGAFDIDCYSPYEQAYGCPGEKPFCSSNGTECIESRDTSGWTCDPDLKNDGRTCSCGCGEYDPDCDNPLLPVINCGGKNDTVAYGDWKCDTQENNYTCLRVNRNTPGYGYNDIPYPWTCSLLWYNDSRVCHCQMCGMYDPDCANSSLPVSCYQEGNWSCSRDVKDRNNNNATGTCTQRIEKQTAKSNLTNDVPLQWFCDSAFYNASDGCDCECGVQDPDCNDPSSNIFNCEDHQIVAIGPNYACVKGKCIIRPPSPTQIVYEPDADRTLNSNIIRSTVAKCGEFMVTQKINLTGQYDYVETFQAFNESGDFVGYLRDWGDYLVAGEGKLDYEPLSVYLIASITSSNIDFYESPPTPIVWTADPLFPERNKFINVTVTAIPIDPEVNITLSGSTTITIEQGEGNFDDLIVLGPANAEFRLQFSTTDPPLIPAISSGTIFIQTGAPAAFNLTFDGSKMFNNGSFHVASDSVILGNLTILDTCGNPINLTKYYIGVGSFHCDAFYHFRYTLPVNGSCTFSLGNDTSHQISIKIPSAEKMALFSKSDISSSFDIRLTMANSHTRPITTMINFLVTNKTEFNCYRLIDPIVGVTMDDVNAFDIAMIAPLTKLDIAGQMFSIGKDRPNIIRFDFNPSDKTNLPHHAELGDDLKSWVLATKKFYVEQNPDFLTAVSLNLVSVQAEVVNVTFQMPLCGSMTKDYQKSLFGRWLFSLADAYLLTTTASSITNVNITGITLQSASDAVCIVKGAKDPAEVQRTDYLCCERTALASSGLPQVDDPSKKECSIPPLSKLSVALIVLSLVFATVATAYLVAVVFLFFKQNGVLTTVVNKSPEGRGTRLRNAILLNIATPVLAVASLIQNSFMVRNLLPYVEIIIAVVMGVIIITWWIVAFLHTYYVHILVIPIRKRFDYIYDVLHFLLIIISSFNVFLTFAWITLGLLLDPDKVGAYFVGFLTIFGVVYVKVKTLSEMLDEVERRIILKMMMYNSKPKLGEDGEKEELKEEDIDVVEIQKIQIIDLYNYFINAFEDPDAARRCQVKIAKFRRFKVRFLIVNLLGTVSVLLALIVFILLGVEAFRGSSDSSVTTIGSLLEAGAGYFTMFSDSIGSQEVQVEELVAIVLKEDYGMLSGDNEPEEDDRPMSKRDRRQSVGMNEIELTNAHGADDKSDQ